MKPSRFGRGLAIAAKLAETPSWPKPCRGAVLFSRRSALFDHQTGAPRRFQQLVGDTSQEEAFDAAEPPCPANDEIDVVGLGEVKHFPGSVFPEKCGLHLLQGRLARERVGARAPFQVTRRSARPSIAAAIGFWVILWCAGLTKGEAVEVWPRSRYRGKARRNAVMA